VFCAGRPADDQPDHTAHHPDRLSAGLHVGAAVQRLLLALPPMQPGAAPSVAPAPPTSVPLSDRFAPLLNGTHSPLLLLLCQQPTALVTMHFGLFPLQPARQHLSGC